MIRLILLDLGKVLVDFDFGIAVSRLRKIVPINMVKVYKLFRGSSLADRWDKGLIHPRQFFAEVQKEMNMPIGMDQFETIWNEIFSEKKEMIFLATSLLKNYKVYILSNVNPWHADYLRKEYLWLEDFDGFIASCDVRMLKPDPEIFKMVLKKAQVQPRETFFVDDMTENVRAARSLGIDALTFKNFSHLVGEMRKRDLILP